MARVSKYSVFILLAATMLFVAISAASADTLTPSSFAANTSATFNSVSVYYVDASPLANPWGLTTTCPVGCNVNPIGSDGSTPSTVETIVLRDTGTPTSAGLDVTGGVFTVHLFGSNSIFTPGTDSAPAVSNTKGTSVSYSSSLDPSAQNPLAITVRTPLFRSRSLKSRRTYLPLHQTLWRLRLP